MSQDKLHRSCRRALPALAPALVLILATAALLCAASGGAARAGLFGGQEVTAQFATQDGRPLADSEVRVFAPGKPTVPALTGRTDAEGRFRFQPDRDGLWSAEAREGNSRIERVIVRVGDKVEPATPPSPYLIGGLGLLVVVLAFVARRLRRYSRGARRPR